MPSKEQAIEKINQHAPKFISLLGGKLVDFDVEKDACRFEFNIGKDYCHSIDVVQGGFVTAMLDTAMSHAVMALNKDIINISSLEIKTTYLEPTRAGKLRVEGWAVRKGYKVAFVEGHIYNENDVLTATASSVAKLSRVAK
ncbi:PaaI family thioesterase [Paraglaciecola sp. T6c]|uniref:PaaI family thioesterase n=1 Tax=Pseudoalteromonas atlantica (strain T6c / ATCC BAA-1087) TaxID=3042615 RepID=UPI0002E2EE88